MKKILVVITLLMVLCSCQKKNDEVVVYTSVDRLYSQQIFDAFTMETGIKVLAVYDVEATKTTGLVQRLITEKEHPQSDVFWNGEILYTMKLKEEGVLESYQSESLVNHPKNFVDDEFYWTGFGGRARIFMVNLDRVTLSDIDFSIKEMPNLATKYKVGMAKPIFGTTATHTASFYAFYGDIEGGNILKAMRDSQITIVDGNGMVRDMVVSGQLDIGITDTDDALSANLDGKNIGLVFPDQKLWQPGTLVIPNTIALIKNGPHIDNGKLFIDYMLRVETLKKLIEIGWCQLSYGEELYIDPQLEPYLPSDKKLKVIDITYEVISEVLEHSSEDAAQLFLD